MGCINKQTLKRTARRREKIDLPECGPDAFVYVSEMGAKDLHTLRAAHNPPPPESFFDFEFDLLARCLVDESGAKLFDNVEDVRENSDLSITTIQRLATEALKLSGIDTKKN